MRYTLLDALCQLTGLCHGQLSYLLFGEFSVVQWETYLLGYLRKMSLMTTIAS